MRIFFLQIILLFFLPDVNAQCNVKSKVSADGVVLSYTARELLYEFKGTNIYSTIKYDGIDYYFRLQLEPSLPDFIQKENILINFVNDKTIELKFFDGRLNEQDSSLSIEYLIVKEQLELLSQVNIRSIKMNFKSGENIFTLISKPSLIKEQLICITKK